MSRSSNNKRSKKKIVREKKQNYYDYSIEEKEIIVAEAIHKQGNVKATAKSIVFCQPISDSGKQDFIILNHIWI